MDQRYGEQRGEGHSSKCILNIPDRVWDDAITEIPDYSGMTNSRF